MRPQSLVRMILVVGGFLFVSSTVSAMIVDQSAIHSHKDLKKSIDNDLFGVISKPVDMDLQEIIFDTIILQDDIVNGYTPNIVPMTNSPPNVEALHL